jgi:hypothetical protein
VRERRLPCQAPLLRLALQLMHVGVSAPALCRKGALLTLPHPGRLQDLWPSVTGLLVEGALLAPEDAADPNWEWDAAVQQGAGWRVLVHSLSVNEVTRKVLQVRGWVGGWVLPSPGHFPHLCPARLPLLQLLRSSACPLLGTHTQAASSATCPAL